MIKRHYIGLINDPTLNHDIIVFSVKARDTKQARQGIHQWYEASGWPDEGLLIRLVALRGKDIQYIGHATPSNSDVEAIRKLCEEILALAEQEPIVSFSGDKLRDLVKSFAIGKQVFEAKYDIV